VLIADLVSAKSSIALIERPNARKRRQTAPLRAGADSDRARGHRGHPPRMGERFQADRGGPGFQRPVSVKVVVGGAAGRVLGMRSARYVESLLYQVKAAEPDIAALPALAILSVAVVAILPAISRAMRIEPAEILRSE